MTTDRFDYDSNFSRAKSYRGRRSPFWPPVDTYEISFLDFTDFVPDLGADFTGGLVALKAAIDAEWQRVKEVGSPSRTSFNDPGPIADAMRRIGQNLPGEVDRKAITLRAGAVENGYDDDTLKALANIEEDIAVGAGQIATWYGKQLGGLPTAFAARRDERRQAVVADAFTTFDEVNTYLAQLHADLRLGDVPAFAVTDLFFMAGEGNLHPKHIAYFLPEDEGVKHSPLKKTYYFGNTHRRLLATQSAPLARRLIRCGPRFDLEDARFDLIPALGVFGHELGHCVHRPSTTYKEINAVNRWTSVVLQEVAADVFGILLLADAWASRIGVERADIIAYYLAECMRYVNRGLGHFPDSDGMFLQLSYLTHFGALTIENEQGARLAGDPNTVLAGLRSLARVLADTALVGKADPAVAVYNSFGPPKFDLLHPIVDELRGLPSRSVEYLQEHIHKGATTT